LEQLLSALCDGSLTEPEHTRLESMLTADSECRRHYLEYVDLHADLLAAPGLPAGDFAQPPKPSPAGPRHGRGLGATLSLVAATLIVSGVLQFLWSQRRRGPRNDGSDGALPPLATLAQTFNCSWDGSVRPKARARIGAEELRLRSGFA